MQEFDFYPTCSATIVLQSHPDHALRRFGRMLAVLALVAPIGLELAGILPASYAFEGGEIKVLPQVTELSQTFVLAFMTLANLSLAVMPAAFVGSLRQRLAHAQSHQLLQAWHFRRLGDDLIRAATPCAGSRGPKVEGANTLWRESD